MKTKQDLADFLEKLKQEKSKDYIKLFVKFMEFFRKYFKKQEKFYLKQVENFPVFKTFISKSFEDDLEKLLKSIWKLGKKEAVDEFYKDFIRVGQKPDEIYISNDDIIKYAKQRAWWLIKQVDETTKKQINAIITKWLKENWTLNQLKQEIRNKFKQFSTYRAALIAHMETATAYSVARKNQIKHFQTNSKIQMRKRAKTQQDDKVRPSHRANELAWWIPANQVYPGTWTMNAPHWFFCRCSDIYSPINPENWKIVKEDDPDFQFYTTKQIKKAKKVLWDFPDENFKWQYWLTKQEYDALKYWTWNWYNFLINWFYEAKNSKEYQNTIAFFINALNKLPKVEGVFYRAHSEFYPGEVSNLKIWAVFQTRSFLSSSVNEDVAQTFAKTKNTNIILVFNWVWVDLSDLNELEEEVLILPNKLFKVENIENKDNKIYIYLTEL